MKLSIIGAAFLLTSCLKGQLSSDNAATDSLLIWNNSAKVDSIRTKANENLVISLFKKFERIADDDSVTNFLIEKGKISKNTGDGIYTMVMDIDTIKNALRIEDSESGNSSFVISEYRVIKSGNFVKFIHSKLVGTNAFTSQDKIEVYDYDLEHKMFKLDPVSTNIFEDDIKDFFLQETPDSVILEYSTHSSNFFHIVYNESGIAEYILNDHYTLEDQKNNKWILGNTIKFEFTDNRFTRSKPYYAE